MTELQGQRALVIGAGGGIGRAIARALAARGADLWLAGRRLEPLAETAAGIVPRERVLDCWTVDLESDDAPRRLARAVGDASLDILVHAAGRFTPGSPLDIPPEEVHRLFRVNALAPISITCALAPALGQARGQVVVINSSAATQPSHPWSVYAASKTALRTLTDGLRQALNPRGVRVLSVFPGRTATPMQAAIFAMERRPYTPERLVQPEDVAAMVIAALLTPRTAEVTELHLRPMQAP